MLARNHQALSPKSVKVCILSASMAHELAAWPQVLEELALTLELLISREGIQRTIGYVPASSFPTEEIGKFIDWIQQLG